ncbi:MAG: zinc ribbon domain-containing protein [Coriobacteriia bacterium]|nr:zinc ribbon domain-containing protein [Coriobacteriia bacterium]MCL2870788.1 zinc ribbon domain-containing protein [Coriobacteriia bacterium]
MLYCEECGTKLPKDGVFCESCGHRLSVELEQEVPVKSIAESKNLAQKVVSWFALDKKRLAIIGLGAALLVAIPIANSVIEQRRIEMERAEAQALADSANFVGHTMRHGAYLIQTRSDQGLWDDNQAGRTADAAYMVTASGELWIYVSRDGRQTFLASTDIGISNIRTIDLPAYPNPHHNPWNCFPFHFVHDAAWMLYFREGHNGMIHVMHNNQEIGLAAPNTDGIIQSFAVRVPEASQSQEMREWFGEQLDLAIPMDELVYDKDTGRAFTARELIDRASR